MTHYLIYKITNNLNGKIYIGQHKTEDLNDGYMGSGVAIKRAIRRYGLENFSKEILYDVDDWELMDFLEELIVDEEFVKRKDTYNMKTGGSCGIAGDETRRKIAEAGWGKHPSEETRQKLSTAHKGTSFSEEHRRKISEANLGKHSKHLSEEHKRKISEAHKGKPHQSGMTGKQQSEETRRKIAEARRKYWAMKKEEVNTRKEKENAVA